MATILPTGETQFFDANGDPLAGGTVTFYIPGTTTPKDTWQNSGQSILNANPVTLDSAGRAIIYGSGAYRQVVKDSLGNLIWDQETSEPNAGSVSFGGTSGGTANAQTLSAAQFSFGDGQIISFVAGITNTGATTMAVGGGSPIPILKNGVSGPVALAASDIVAGNSYFIQYSTSLAAFQLLLSVAPALPSGAFLTGYLWGMTLSNNGTDVVNDIDIAAGYAASDGATPVLMTLASTLTKRSDATWAVGNGNGWLDTGSIANNTYHVFIIQRSDTGVVDSLLSLSATSPTMPANYDRKRRIGSILRRSGSITRFNQFGDYFNLIGQISNFASGTSFPAALLTLSVPTGIIVRPLLSCQTATGATGVIQNSMGSAAAGSVTIAPYQQIGSNQSDYTTIDFVSTNTSAQIYFQSSVSGAILTNAILTTGWVDTRGRLA
ncbi:MAG TPA: hypothetical protein VJ846_07060 [Sphingomicrobium sp.]|nr:hypothetical protein [Sphingomicrobium sp.]